MFTPFLVGVAAALGVQITVVDHPRHAYPTMEACQERLQVIRARAQELGVVVTRATCRSHP